jgi:carbonic anhydrase
MCDNLNKTNDVKKLLKGYESFKNNYLKENQPLLEKLATKGQSPKTLIISCCDSRVEPNIIFDCDPGDLFVVRNIANLVPPCEKDAKHHGTSAALEYAVNELKVENVIVLGHSQCGGIKALIQSDDISKDVSFVGVWLSQLIDAKSKVLAKNPSATQEELYYECEKEGIAQSIKNLMSFPWIEEKVNAKTLALHGWYYDLESSKIFSLNEKTNELTPISLS